MALNSEASPASFGLVRVPGPPSLSLPGSVVIYIDVDTF